MRADEGLSCEKAESRAVCMIAGVEGMFGLDSLGRLQAVRAT